MKRLVLIVLLALMPALAFASVTGVDDFNPNLTVEEQKLLDETITTYYQHPTPQAVETVLDMMNNSSLLLKKAAWPPIVGFLSVVFEHNKKHLFRWMSRNDYNSYAQDVFITSLLHAKLKETALVFAQAHQWKKSDLARIRTADDQVDFKHLAITAPGHIDTLWGAFFASGDRVYVNEIIDVLYVSPLTAQEIAMARAQGDDTRDQVIRENKKLAETSLRQYAPVHKPVRDALMRRISTEKDKDKKQLLQNILPKHHETIK